MEAIPGLIIYRFTHSIYYANAQRLAEEITDLVNTAEPPLRWFCIDASAVDDLDYTAAETIRTLHGILKEKEVRLVVAHVMEDVEAQSSYRIKQLLGKDGFYATLRDVMNDYQRQTGIAAKLPSPAGLDSESNRNESGVKPVVRN